MLATLLLADHPALASSLVGLAVVTSIALGCLLARFALDLLLMALRRTSPVRL